DLSGDGNYLDIWSSRSGKEGTWEEISIAEDWVNRKHHIAIVLGEEPTPAQVPQIESSIGAAGDVVITLAADGLSATARVPSGYVGAVASVAISGGYLGGDDYQIISSGDDSVLQLGADRQINIVSAQNLTGNSVQTFQLTMVIDDHYADNAADTKTLALVLEVLPSLTVSLSGQAEATVFTGPLGDIDINFYTLTASEGSGTYVYKLITLDAYLLPHVTFVAEGSVAYLSLTAMFSESEQGAGDAVIEVDDGLNKATLTVRVIGKFKSLTDDSVSGYGSLLIAGGYRFSSGLQFLQDVWASSDLSLETWDKITTSGFPTPGIEQAVVFYNGYLYLMGGAIVGGAINYKQVWRSADGVQWTAIANMPAASDVGWLSAGLVVHNNKMLLMGGQEETGGSYRRDVWSSIDGIQWERLAENKFPNFGSNFSSAVLNNTIYLTERSSRDLWSSADGVDWTVHSNVFAAEDVSNGFNGANAVVFRGSLFIIDSVSNINTDNEKIRYSSTPTDPTSWTVYDGGGETQLDGAALVYKDKLIVTGGNISSNIWASSSGKNNEWYEITVAYPELVRQEGDIAVVLGDAPTAAQVPPIESSIVAAGEVAITVAADGLTATATVSAGYVGAVASLAIAGGYLGSGDYQISSSGDDSVLQVGADRQIRVVSGQNSGGSNVQTFQLTIVIDDQYANNAGDSKTLVLVVEVLPAN
nr:hypothetical protein [Pseudomonadota bacterium]